MSETNPGQIDVFLDTTIEKTRHIEQALGHLAKAIELELVDVALDPSVANNGSREKFIDLAQRLAALSGISYELVADISAVTGIPLQIEQDESISAELPGQTASPSHLLEEGTKPTTSVNSSEPNEPNEISKLYCAIVDPAELPEMRPVEEAEAISAEIITDASIRIGGKDILLNGHELFLFNAMLLLRAEPRVAGEIRALGFFPDAKGKANSINQAFSLSMNKLLRQLNNAAGKEIIKKIGEKRATRYALNPKLVLSDKRSESGTVSSNPESGVKKN